MPQEVATEPETTFQLPRNGLIYTNAIIERSRQMMRAKIWEGISPPILDAWMANFENDTECYFGACILDSLIYRSESQTIALMKQVLDRELPTHFALRGITGSPFSNINQYLGQQPPSEVRPLAIVPVIRRADPPTKSGPLIARMLKRHLNVNQYHLLWPWQIREWLCLYKTRNIVFVDDLLGTGSQFRNFVSEFELSSLIQEIECVYCPLVAHAKGIRKLNDYFPNLHIFPVEH